MSKPSLNAGPERVEHTPTPWAASRLWPTQIVSFDHVNRPMGGSIFEDEDRDRFALVIASCPVNAYSGFAHEIAPAQVKANAAFIVRAVNAHDDLVNALEEIAQAKMPGQARSIARATLSKIKAEAK